MAAAARPRRRRKTTLTVAGVLAVAGAGAVAGLLIQQSAGGSLSGAGAAVASVLIGLGGGGIETASGMVLTPSGEVLTSEHTVAGATSISVRVPGRGAAFAAAIVGLDPTDDVALLQLQDASGLPVVSIGDSSGLTQGQRVSALVASEDGAPVRLEGAVSGFNQTINATDAASGAVATISGAIQVSVPVPAGACGGPVIDSSGRVVAMVAAAASQLRPPASGGGWAVPINTVVAVAHDMVSGAPNPRVLQGHGAVLGVNVESDTNPLGARVIAVSPDSPAQAAGIVPGDVIVAIDGLPVSGADGVPAALRNRHAGDRIVVTWLTQSGTLRRATAQLASGTAQ